VEGGGGEIATGDVAGGEGDHQLLGLVALVPRLRHHVLVKGDHSLLETGELHHGVGDLPAPQGNQRFVESVDALNGGWIIFLGKWI
jgi:hypothetical protein